MLNNTTLMTTTVATMLSTDILLSSSLNNLNQHITTTTSDVIPLLTPKCQPIESLELFGRIYGEMHGYITLFLCPICVLSNICIVIVLNQRNMISPTNFLLTSLAISDGLLMMFYIPFASYFLIGRHTRNSSHNWAVYLLFHISLQNFLHLTSSYIVVVIAVFRVLYVKFLLQCHILCSMQRARFSITIVLIISSILSIPCIMNHHIVRNNNQDEVNGYMVTYVDNEVMLNYLYWNTAIFLKLLPLLCLCILSFMIIFIIRKQNSRMRKLKIKSDVIFSGNSVKSTNSPINPLTTHSDSLVDDNNETDIDKNHFINHDTKCNVNVQLTKMKKTSSSSHTLPVNTVLFKKRNLFENEREKAENRMTKFLLAIVFIFMITLLPQAILLFLSGLVGDCFTDTVYNALGDFMDLLTIINNGINFILYCSMSHQFRTTFIQFCNQLFNLCKKV
ncbi:Sex peptide receptor [Schistosoma japonicum]|uniref:Sex peptide receptor n=1 Tax=Schistosoma japonicum TaxID=6182 RepID=A0A4Z2D1V4_SCHJA|nr:Dro/myosuppressin receptor [Schistosoma japonicum]TNN10485.1 Sex peptide receptor [Schistosoma japonicum]